jgi:fatty acid desaturase
MIIDTHPLIEWVIGGLNRHTAHHLFPTAPSHALPALTDIVAASCAAYGVTLHRYASLRASWVEVGHYLWALGKDPRCSTSTAVEC